MSGQVAVRKHLRPCGVSADKTDSLGKWTGMRGARPLLLFGRPACVSQHLCPKNWNPVRESHSLGWFCRPETRDISLGSAKCSGPGLIDDGQEELGKHKCLYCFFIPIVRQQAPNVPTKNVTANIACVTGPRVLTIERTFSSAAPNRMPPNAPGSALFLVESNDSCDDAMFTCAAETESA